MLDLFADEAPRRAPAPGAVVLRRFAFRAAQSLLDDIGFVASQSPFRQMVTPGGYTMSVAMTNCGALGWTTDRHGYCYAVRDPLTDKPRPALPLSFASVCRQAAIAAGYASFQPDACLINRYAPGAKLSLHQDKDSRICARLLSQFRWGCRRFSVWRPASRDPIQRILLEHGDIVVWGGESRLFYHGIQPLKAGFHPMTGEFRYNLTFRQAAEKE